MSKNYIIKENGKEITVKVEKDLLGFEDIPLFMDTLEQQVRKKPEKIILNLKITKHLDSSAIGNLVKFSKQLEEAGITLVLLNLNDRLKKLLVELRLGVFEIQET